MKVAILVSTYNGEKYLRSQIDSLLGQKGNFEVHIILRDDGSQDGTRAILEEYSAKNSNMTWFCGQNLKPAKSFIDILWKCGEYDFYCFCDQDDVWDSNKIEIGIKTIRNIEIPCIYYSNVRLVDSNLNPYGVNLYKKTPCNDIFTVMCASNVIGCTMIMNHQLVAFLRAHEFPDIVAMHDSYIARVCLSIGGKIIYNHTPYMNYRQHKNNVVGVKKGNIEKIKYAIQKMMDRPTITIDMQAQEILRLYADDISNCNKMWLRQIADYRINFISRLKLALSRKPTYGSLSMSIQMRTAILLGNR